MNTTVLLLDAFADERRMYTEYLEATGFIVRSFDSVDAALADASRHAPDIAITRLRHPNREVVGLDFIARLKSNPLSRHVPVLMMSTWLTEEDRKAAFAVGCDRYLLLPCLPHDLAAEVGLLLARSERARRDSRRAHTPLASLGRLSDSVLANSSAAPPLRRRRR
jgi:DNA-binding response OmpR family regulator